MTAGAAPARGRRVRFGALAGAAVLFLLTAAFYVLWPFALLSLFGPLAVLTVLSRPRSVRELVWLIVAGAVIATNIATEPGLGAEMLRAAALLAGGIFVVISLRGALPVFPRALLAVFLTSLGLGIWAVARGIGWPDLERAFTELLRSGYGFMMDAFKAQTTARTDLTTMVQQLIDGAPRLARVLPGVLALIALASLAQAWKWHHRIATTPLGRPPAPFQEFRFNDHLIWGAIFALGLLLIPLPPGIDVLGANLLVVWAGLYVARGVAIIAKILAPAPATLKYMAAGLGILSSPISLGACVALGLADTWLDIRGRFAPPATGGNSQ